MAISMDGDFGFGGDLGMFAGTGFGAGDHRLRIASRAAGILSGGCAGRCGDGAAVGPFNLPGGSTWGFDGRGIWVDRGCKAEFRLAAYSGHGPVWFNSGRQRPRDFQDGACFFSDANFGGEYFCMRRGESYDSLPAGFNDRISSIQVIGRARVAVFNDDGFRGVSLGLKRSVGNLKQFRRQDDPSKTWNDRISSIRGED